MDSESGIWNPEFVARNSGQGAVVKGKKQRSKFKTEEGIAPPVPKNIPDRPLLPFGLLLPFTYEQRHEVPADPLLPLPFGLLLSFTHEPRN